MRESRFAYLSQIAAGFNGSTVPGWCRTSKRTVAQVGCEMHGLPAPNTTKSMPGHNPTLQPHHLTEKFVLVIDVAAWWTAEPMARHDHSLASLIRVNRQTHTCGPAPALVSSYVWTSGKEPSLVSIRLHQHRLIDRRTVITFMVLATGACTSNGPSVARSTPQSGGISMAGMTAQDCIDSCLKSHASCMATARHCTEVGGRHATANHLALLMDCAELCQATANSLMRRSPQHGIVCNACAALCDACAQDCESFKDDVVMQRCAAVCRECAGHCRMMSTQTI